MLCIKGLSYLTHFNDFLYLIGFQQLYSTLIMKTINLKHITGQFLTEYNHLLNKIPSNGLKENDMCGLYI